jgi:class 3 adenylate cyclase
MMAIGDAVNFASRIESANKKEDKRKPALMDDRAAPHLGSSDFHPPFGPPGQTLNHWLQALTSFC